MMNNDLVSVVIATYNMGNYIESAIDSILKQSYQNFELIVVDDGSVDDTEQRMVAYGDNAKIKYIKQENQGQPKAKNRGLKETTGAYVAFCDADDLWAPNKLELQLPLFKDHPEVGVVYSEVSYIDDKGNPLDKEQPYERYSGNVTDKLILKNFIPFGTAIVKKQCFDEMGLFDENLPMGIDWDLWLRFSTRYKIMYTPAKTYIYRIWPGQMSSNYRGRYHHAELIMNKFISNNPGVLSKKTINRAWSDTYNSKGMAIAKAEKTIKEPLSNIMTALRHDIKYIPAWKSLVKIIIRRTG